jgi:hypothetical protein
VPDGHHERHVPDGLRLPDHQGGRNGSFSSPLRRAERSSFRGVPREGCCWASECFLACKYPWRHTAVPHETELSVTGFDSRVGTIANRMLSTRLGTYTNHTNLQNNFCLS